MKDLILVHGADHHQSFSLPGLYFTSMSTCKVFCHIYINYLTIFYFQVGDSIVSKGKETLERAIKLVETTPKWKARVIYGDTDSLFILLSGKSRYDAFKIGAEIADAVTATNPSPVKLKFEKVLQPCILQVFN